MFHIAAVAVVYFAAARLGLLLAFRYKNVSPVWPPSGVALASLMLVGWRVWPGVAIGAFAANVTTGLPVLGALIIAAGNTLEGVCSAWILRRCRWFNTRLSSVQDVFLLVVAAVGGPLIASTIGVASVRGFGFIGSDAVPAAWLTWWIGDGMGILVLGGALLAWGTRETSVPRRQARLFLLQAAEACAVTLAVVAAGVLVFGPGRPYPYAVFPPLIWAAVRFRQRGASAGVVGITGVAVWATVRNLGPFVRADVQQSLVYLQTFMAAMAPTVLLLGAAISERGEASEALARAEQRFRLALANTDLVVYSQDLMLRYTWIYDGKGRFQPSQVVGRTDADLASAEEARQLAEIKQRVIDTGMGDRQEVTATTNGTTRTYDLAVEPLRDEKSALVGVSGVAMDVTEIREYQRAIESLNDRLRRAMRETHHRVKNNLQVIAAMVDLRLMDGAEHVPAAEVQRLSAHARTLAMVHDLLTQEAKTDEAADSLSAEAVIGKLIPMLQQLAPERKLRLGADEGVRLRASRATSLAIIVSELVSNALKHGAGAVDVTIRSSGSAASLEVRDHGPGFPEDFSLEGSANTGLELAAHLSHWDLGGKLTVSNAPGGGACVTVTFPPEEESSPEARTTSEQAASIV